MAEDRKTLPTAASVDTFLASVASSKRQADARSVAVLIGEVTGESPRMWGPSIVGYGVTEYRTADGKRRETMTVGFAPRKAALVLYGLQPDDHADEVAALGAVTTGKSCVYIKSLDAVDLDALRSLIRTVWDDR